MSSPHVVDLLVIGGGIAGGACALRAADLGLSVLTVVKAQDPRSTATGWAQGGIVAEGDEDPPSCLLKTSSRPETESGGWTRSCRWRRSDPAS